MVKKTKNGLCGVNPFCTTEDDPFIECCKIHDKEYDILPAHKSTEKIDKEFLECCLAVAKTDKPLQIRARIYYHLCRGYGRGRYLLGRFGVLTRGFKRTENKQRRKRSAKESK